MVDLHPAIYKLLKGVCRVSMEFPSTAEQFPVITLAEVSNIEDLTLDGTERISDVTYQVDVWDNGKNRQRCEQLAAEAAEILTGHGFTRILGRGFRDASGLHRKMMYFKLYAINLKEDK